MNRSIDFLEKIYSLQGEAGDYFILSVKGPGVRWKDIPIKYQKDEIQSKLEEVFDQYDPEEYDLYFSPMPFSRPHRKIEYGKETKYLIQDIDEYDDPDKLNPTPSYLWESSPNKYQGIWELDRYIGEKEYTPLNKALAHHIGCDDCFDWCHVYRIPGTTNHKYKDHPQVSYPIASRKIYKPRTLSKMLKVKPDKKVKEETQSADLNERKIYAKYDIPKKIRDLLALDSLEGIDRSSTIWYIENSLNDLGMSPQEIIYLVRNSIFNKYSGRADEDKRLKSELKKIISGKLVETENKAQLELKVSTFSQVMTQGEDFSGWLVKGFWGKNSHGIVAGMPKCFKSTIVHDLAVSVASGTHFLGKFPVLDSGPVIMVQNENADYMIRDRNEKLIINRGIAGSIRYKRNGHLRVKFPKDIPLYFINQQGFMLSSEDHRRKLEDLIQKVRPVLVIFDPLYLMFDGEINSAKELTPALNWLLYLKREYQTSVMVIHHYNKGTNQGSSQRGGARMMGSIVLYGWVESAWYLSREEENGQDSDRAVDESDLDNSSEEAQVVTMAREFRMAGHFPDIDIHLDLGEVGDMKYNATVAKAGNNHTISEREIKDRIIDTLSSSNLPASRRKLSEQTGVDRNRLREVLEKMVQQKKIKVDAKGYSIYK